MWGTQWCEYDSMIVLGLWPVLYGECTKANGSNPVGPINCIDCMAEARRDESWDFTVDNSLLL